MVFQDHGHPVLVKEGNPVLPLVFPCAEYLLAVLADSAFGVTVGRIGRDMVDNNGVRKIPTSGQGFV